MISRPECFDFAMDFLGGPDNDVVEKYVEELEKKSLLINEVIASLKEVTDAYVNSMNDDDSNHINPEFDPIVVKARNLIRESNDRP